MPREAGARNISREPFELKPNTIRSSECERNIEGDNLRGDYLRKAHWSSPDIMAMPEASSKAAGASERAKAKARHPYASHTEE